MQAAIRGGTGSEVPCGNCTACCTSFHFVHVGPDEIDTLTRIPAALLTPAPRLPVGHMVLGYDEHGHCPMLVDNQCSIYEHRPRACRTYDCRLFAATGVEFGNQQELIARRARRWRFRFPSETDRTEAAAVRAAVTFLERNPDLLPGSTPATPGQLAATAVTIAGAFVAANPSDGSVRLVSPDPGEVRRRLTRTGAAGE
jgi:Fe-S-cluster containining protein